MWLIIFISQVINERDILGTQLIRRNDELALLYEKIKIQQSTLNKGEVQYSQRLEDIRILKLEIKKMRRERTILSKSVANVDDLRYYYHSCYYKMTFKLHFDSFVYIQTWAVPCPTWTTPRADQVQGTGGWARESNEHSSMEETRGQWPKHVWDGAKDTHTTEKANPENPGGKNQCNHNS